MIQHVSDDLLRRFVRGALDDDVAIAVADHVDACPLCATRAVAAEPLAGAFAAVDDPPCPADLIDAILLAAEAPVPRPAPKAELLASAALLSAAAMLLLGLGEPLSLLAEGVVVVSAAASGAGVFLQQVQALSPWTLLSLTAGVLLLSVVTSTRLWQVTPPRLERAA